MSITAKITVDNSELKKGLKDAENTAKKSMQGVAGASGSAAKGIEALGRSVSTMASQSSSALGGLTNVLTKLGPIGIGVAAAIAASAYGIKKVFDSIGNITQKVNDMAKNANGVNMEVDAYIGLQRAANHAGIELTKILQLISKLDLALSKAAEYDMKYVKAFAALGMSWKELELLTPEKKIMAVNEAYRSLVSMHPVMPAGFFDIFSKRDLDTFNRMAKEGDRFNEIIISSASKGYGINQSMIDFAQKYQDTLGDAAQKWSAIAANMKLTLRNW